MHDFLAWEATPRRFFLHWKQFFLNLCPLSVWDIFLRILQELRNNFLKEHFTKTGSAAFHQVKNKDLYLKSRFFFSRTLVQRIFWEIFDLCSRIMFINVLRFSLIFLIYLTLSCNYTSFNNCKRKEQQKARVYKF